jgi:hypothetical protein
LSVVHISFSFVVSPGFKRTTDHKAQAAPVGKTDELNASYLNFAKASFGRGTAQYAGKRKTKNNATKCYSFLFPES